MCLHINPNSFGLWFSVFYLCDRPFLHLKMAFSVQNKNFLAVLNKLDIDVKQFPDKTFDGLFDNIPEATNYFFNWFIENISPDNALTQSEQAIYFQLESTQSLPTEEEVNYVLSSCNPTYEELKSLDVNYVNNFLSKDLDDLKKNYADLSDILTLTEGTYNNVIKKQNKLKEGMTAKKKQLNAIKQDSEEMNLSFGSKVDEVRIFLLKEPHFKLDLSAFTNLLGKEEDIFRKFKSSKLVEKKFLNCSKLELLPCLESDLACVEISLILSEGFLKVKKAKIDFLSELLQKKTSQKSSNNYNMIQFHLMDNNGIDNKISEEIKVLETELIEKQKKVCHSEVQKISDEYLQHKTDLNNSYISKVTKCKDYMRSNSKINSCLLHILLRCNTSLENTLDIRKQLYSKLIKLETNFSNDVTNLELRKQRFKEVSLQQHPFLSTLRSVMALEENPENNEETLQRVMQLILQANDDSNFTTPKLRNDLQTSIRGLLENTLCGPTNQVLLVPIELLIKFQDCDEQQNKLSQLVKRIASKYVDAKDTISKSDRKKLLLWIDFITNPELFTAKKSPPF